jgi:hypothetical protein
MAIAAAGRSSAVDEAVIDVFPFLRPGSMFLWLIREVGPVRSLIQKRCFIVGFPLRPLPTSTHVAPASTAIRHQT